MMSGGGAESSNAAVVIVNWNRWPDTLECLEAVFRVQGFRGLVVVCDNGSTDGSAEMIEAWARGHVCALPQNQAASIAELVIPPVDKPISCSVIDADNVQTAAASNWQSCKLLIVRARENHGFAAANNLGIRILLGIQHIKFFWFINNDALPHKESLNELIAALRTSSAPVIAGSAIVEYWNPRLVQALGGRYQRYTGLTAHLLEGVPIEDLFKLPRTIPVDYPIGAGMLVSRSFVERFGGMCEDYFLYFEEIDWALRMGWPSKAVSVPRSIVYHKGGSSTKAGRAPSERSLEADYYMLRGRLLLARKLSIAAFLITFTVNLISIVRRLLRPRRRVFLNAIQATLDGLAGVKGKRDRWPVEG